MSVAAGRPRPTARRLAPALAAPLVVVSLLATGAPLGPLVTRAATPDLTLVGTATYEVRPDEGRIAVTVDLVATNRLRDTVTRSYYFDRATLVVHGEAESLAISAPDASTAPTVRVSSHKDGAAILDIRFGQRLRGGKSLALHLTFDLVDHGGAPDRWPRVSPSLVLFQAWAFATPETPGARTRVVLPDGYAVRVGRGPLDGPTVDPADPAARQALDSGLLDAPASFIADIAADRPGGYTELPRSTTVGDSTAIVRLRSWPDDPAWEERVSSIVLRALPALGVATGRPWPLDRPLIVTESLPSAGAAGATYDPVAGELVAGYATDDATLVRALAHAWFDGALVADRWAAEGFAALAAEQAGLVLGLEVPAPTLTRDSYAGLIPLNAWGLSGSVTPEQEAYAVAASADLARAIAERAGPDALARVWAAAAAQAAASASGPPDWRGLLDLLEAATGTSYEDLWRGYVVRSEDTPLLRDRAAARAAHAEVLVRARGWRLPADLEAALSAWRFDAALGIIDDATGVLRQRDELEAAAAERDLVAPGALRTAFEGPDGLRAAAIEAAAEMGTLAVLDAAAATRPAEPDPVVRLGLLFEQPEADLATARAAFERGELDASIAAAERARATWLAATDVGGERLLRLVIGLLALAALAIIGLRTLQRRRPRRVNHARPARRAAH